VKSRNYELSRILTGGLLLTTLLVSLPVKPEAGQQRPDAAFRMRLMEVVSEADSFVDRFDAEVWLLDMSTRLREKLPNHDERLRILEAVHREAMRAGLAPELVLAVIEVESNFDRFAISEAGARGLMQVMPFWLDEIGQPDDDLFHIETNLRMGCSILKIYLEQENNQLGPALARYNGSVGKTWYPTRVFSAYNRRWLP
jgi:soluble lytic murein transglycosylase-like protein